MRCSLRSFPPIPWLPPLLIVVTGAAGVFSAHPWLSLVYVPALLLCYALVWCLCRYAFGLGSLAYRVAVLYVPSAVFAAVLAIAARYLWHV